VALLYETAAQNPETSVHIAAAEFSRSANSRLNNISYMFNVALVAFHVGSDALSTNDLRPV
jgi:hypothetical protein